MTASSTVATLKEAIFKQQGVPVERQVLVFGGKVLGADLELRQYNVWRGATVHLSVLPTAKAAAMPPPGRCTAGGGEVPWYAWSRAGGEAPGEGEGEPEGEPAAEE